MFYNACRARQLCLFFPNLLIDYWVISKRSWRGAAAAAAASFEVALKTHAHKHGEISKAPDVSLLILADYCRRSHRLTLAHRGASLPSPRLEWPLAHSLLEGRGMWDGLGWGGGFGTHFRQSLIWEANDKAEVYRRSFAHAPKFAFKGPQVIFGLI